MVENWVARIIRGYPNYFDLSLKENIFLKLLTQNLHVFCLIIFPLIQSWFAHRATSMSCWITRRSNGSHLATGRNLIHTTAIVANDRENTNSDTQIKNLRVRFRRKRTRFTIDLFLWWGVIENQFTDIHNSWFVFIRVANALRKYRYADYYIPFDKCKYYDICFAICGNWYRNIIHQIKKHNSA